MTDAVRADRPADRRPGRRHLPVPAVLRRRRRAPPADPRHPGHLRPRQRGRAGPGPGPAQRRPCRSSRAATSRPWCTSAIGLRQGDRRRHATLAVTASIGPGALNMVTGAGAGHRQPAAGAAAARRHLRHPAAGPGAAAAAAPGRGRRHASTTRSGRSRRFFDRITRPEQLLTALPAAMRVLTDPVDTGAVVLSLPQDVQSHAYDFPAEFFAERDWVIRRPLADPDEVAAVARLLAARAEAADHRGRRRRLLRRHRRARGARRRRRHPGAGDLRRQGRGAAAGLVADRRHRPGGHPGHQRPGPRGRPRAHRRVAADRLRRPPRSRCSRTRTCGSRSINVNRATPTGSAPPASSATPSAPWPRWPTTSGRAGIRAPAAWRDRVRAADRRAGRRCGPPRWTRTPVRPRDVPAGLGDVVPDTDAVLTQGQLIGLLQEHARPGDTIIAAAGGPPGDLQKVWDATERPLLPPGVRLLLHGLRDPGRDRRPAGRRRTAAAGRRRSSATAPS